MLGAARIGLLALSVAAGCRVATREPRFVAEPWPEADRAFRADPRWMGADDAYTVDLGGSRVLWLFADTFIDPTASRRRAGSTMVRNSIAIQHGRDPSCAAIDFHFATSAGKPASFFADDGDQWFWPGGGLRVGDALVVFLMRVRAVKTGLGFEVIGSDAAIVTNPDDAPEGWRVERHRLPQNPWGVVVGSGTLLVDGEFLLAFGAREPGGAHDVFVTRFALNDVRAGRFDDPQWWAGADGFVRQGDRGAPPPTVLFTDGATEFTVHRDERTGSWLEFQATGFGAADLMRRTAPDWAGPWTAGSVVYSPPEKRRPNVLIYAGKAHPELLGGDLVLTYATNSFDFAELVRDDSIYFPRFVRVRFD